MNDHDLPLALRQMTDDTRRQLAEDVRRYGARVLSEGLGDRGVAREIPDLPPRRAKRLAAWGAAQRRGVDVDLGQQVSDPASPDVQVVAPVLDDDAEPIGELLARRSAAFRRKAARRELGRVSRIRLPTDDPIALCYVGDQHVDDDGCNLPRLMRDLETIRGTPGMHAINLGDISNNWVGRLERLWAHQGTTLDDTERLIRWLLGAVPWLAVVLGNHDHWNGGASQIRLLQSLAGGRALIAQHELRLQLEWPCGHRVRQIARHSFKGSSIWNSAHGPLRASKLDPWAHIYVQGHHHEAVAHHEPGVDGVWRVVGKAAGYKWYDSYAEQLGYSQNRHGGCLVVICDPHAPESDQLAVCWDVEEAAARLTELRRRRAA